MKEQLSIINAATQKINLELKNFREVEQKKPGKDIYGNAMTIMFFEATASYSTALTKRNPEIAPLIIQQHASLEGCTKAVIEMAKKIGNLGDISKDDFFKAIWDYFKLDHTKILQQELAAKEKADTQKRISKEQAASIPKSSSYKGNEKSKDTLQQISLFGGISE